MNPLPNPAPGAPGLHAFNPAPGAPGLNPFNPGGLQVIIPQNNHNQNMPNPNDPFWNPVAPAQVVPPIAYQFQNTGVQNVPRGSENLISRDDIEENDEMIDFHGEKALGRFYKRNTFNSLEHKPTHGKKVNPFTRAPIEAANVRTYRAHLVGGKSKKSKKSKKTKKTKKSRKLKKSC